MRRITAIGELPRHDRILITSCIAVITVLAWAYLVHLDGRMLSSAAYDKAMAAMGMPMHGSWTATDALFTFAMWAVMMVGMMAVSTAPVILLFAATQASRRPHGSSLAIPAFGSGYLAIWIGFSACATFAQWVLHQGSLLSPAMAASSSRLAGVILIAAGAYQLTPWKNACLAHCRGPLGFLLNHWRAGALGAFQMGLRHGLYCLGCCWALMAVLFVVGVMNLVWVAGLTVFVLIEKLGPAGPVIARLAGVSMIALGVYVAAAA